MTIPIKELRVESDASHLLVQQPKERISSRIVGEVEVQPGELSHMSLGTFPSGRLPKGFWLDSSNEAITTQITSLAPNKDNSCELVLHITSDGHGLVSVEVWQLS